MSVSSLPDVQGGASSLDALPDVLPSFFMPRLADKPQNPIMDTLNLLHGTRKSATPAQRLPDELQVLVQDAWLVREEDLWGKVAANKAVNSNRVMSWDALRLPFNARALPSPFLSQQSSQIFASARYYVRSPLQDPTTQLVYVTTEELLQSLRMSLTGTSSALYLWDPTSETFMMRNIKPDKRGVIIMIGKDEVVSSSLCQRCLSIGTLLRRLETLVVGQRTRRFKAESIAYAYTHALSTILAYLRSIISSTIRGENGTSDESTNLTALWLSYAEVEEILQALSALCSRTEDMHPSSYEQISTSPPELLSHIFQHFKDHLERHSSRVLLAILAYILTITSRDYFRHLGHSVGYGTPQAIRYGASSVGQMDNDHRIPGLGDEDIFDEDTVIENDADNDTFPSFFEPDVANALSRARKSLTLLRIAQPDHPLFSGDVYHPDIEWFWTANDVEAAWNSQRRGSLHVGMDLTDCRRVLLDEDTTSSPKRSYGKDMEAFAEFDLVPGAHLARDAPGGSLLDASFVLLLQAFIDRFPESLPSLTPTLSHLTNLVLSPLVQHIDTLSGALVSLFLCPSTHLNLHAHLTLLRSYLLLTSHPFKLRLGWALFSDADEFTPSQPGTRTSSKGESPDTRRWAVGLSSALTEGDTWPPGGADLSFHLRTVIIDSLEDGYGRHVTIGSSDSQGSISEGGDRVVEEAEYRLGFAIRDLPSGTGREKWLDPLCTALDFLYMDYKPPKPLDILITPVILSKYHRLFAFNLRLMRVEHVVAALYRMTRRTTAPLFPTLTPANTLLLHFRFAAHAFVAALAAYVADTAIGGTFDAFLASLRVQSAAGGPRAAFKFPDVFALADAHAAVLDDILGACLLRSGQKAVGDLVLALGVLAGERSRGRVQEYAAAPLLEELWAAFRGRMTTLVKVLRALVDKGAGATRVRGEDVRLQAVAAGQIEGVPGSLHNLLVRLDTAEWWAQAGERRTARR
ncbi:Spc98 family-domain-containing protein [Amylocystis lapponica]|nr:Spc98 family-domain-containing protein [Amylocystis lapponica]